MSQSFPWQTFGPEHPANPPTPTIAVEVPGRIRIVTVSGIFDTGADGVELHESLLDPLGISYKDCAPSHSPEGWRPTTVVRARLDGQEFDMPVTFTTRTIGHDPLNIFGRLPFLELFDVRLDRVGQETVFTAVPGAASKRVKDYEAEITAWLKANPDGFQDGYDYTSPNPTA